MRTPLLLVLAAATLIPPADAQRRGRGDRDRDDGPAPKLENITHQEFEFAAPSLDKGKGEAGVYLPAGYDDPDNAERRYPLVIWLHGMNGSADKFLRNGAAVLDRMRGAGEIPDLIFVAPSASRRTAYFNGESSGDYEDLILVDLMKAIEGEFRVANEREQRAIMGVSIGGFGAMRMAFKHPMKFGTLAVHSAPVFPADPSELSERYLRMAQFVGLSEVIGDPIDTEKWQREIPTAMVAKMKPEDLQGLRIYFDAGSADRYGFGPTNAAFDELLTERGIEHTFHLIDGGGHSWGSGFTQEGMGRSLVFVAKGFAGESKAVKPATANKDDGV